MNNRLDNQVIVITGSGRGIGESMAIRCAEEGAKVVITSRTEAQLEETRNQIEQKGGTVLSIPTDVTKVDQIEHLFDTAEREFGSIDLLVNNAGRLGTPGPTWEIDVNDWWTDVTVNLLGTFLCCRTVLPKMIEKKAGRIVNMVGGGTSTPFQFASAYGSSKAAVMRFTETLAVELQQTGNEAVKVFALTPGFVKTAMTESFEQSEEGQKWMSGLLNRMKQGDTVSPRLAADMVVEIGSGRLDGYHGRYLSSERDHDQIDRLIDDIENVLQSDQRTLRLIK